MSAGNGPADYYLEGTWNFRCQECFKKMKATEALRRWDRYWVGPECFEQRNPQDFVRGIPDNQSAPWSTGDPPPIFITDVGSAETTAYNQELNHWQLGSMMLG